MKPKLTKAEKEHAKFMAWYSKHTGPWWHPCRCEHCRTPQAHRDALAEKIRELRGFLRRCHYPDPAVRQSEVVRLDELRNIAKDHPKERVT